MKLGGLTLSFVVVTLGITCFSYSQGYDRQPPPNRNDDGRIPGVSNESFDQWLGDDGNQRLGDVETPYPESGPFRMGDWDFKENWRYNRDAFFSGKSQQEALREDHPYGPGGIGYDADLNYERNLRRHRELQQERPGGRYQTRGFPTQEAFRDRDGVIHYNPYHVQPYQGNYGEGSYNDAYRRAPRRGKEIFD